jgi:hypothetical protein
VSKVVFAGCSFTAGNGWVKPPVDDLYANIECKDYPDLWVNLCHTQIDQLKDLQLVNVGRGGSSNTEIFESAVREIVTDNVKYLFVEWTSMPRYNFNTGLELWNTTEKLHGRQPKHNVKLSNGDFWDREYLTDLLSRLRVLHHLHPEIVKVVSYSKIISNLCKKFNIKVGFINGICPWDKNYFVKLTGNNATPESYTSFTKNKILNIESRSDEDIFILYEKIHNDYNSAGGIDPAEWVNLYHSMANDQLDANLDTFHPGIQSNQLYAQQIKNFLETQ